MLAVPLRPFCAFLAGLGLLCLAFVAAWCQRWRGGFAWDGSARMFNWHPVLMVAGMVVLYGAGEWRGGNPLLPFAPPVLPLLPPGPPRLPLTPLAPPAALVYRLPPAWRGPKLPWKLLHGALALTAFGLTVVGLVAVFGFHNASKTPNMYSLHSWLGLATVLLFSCQVGACSIPPNPPCVPAPQISLPQSLSPQWLAGFSAFLLPYAPPWLRALYKPVHVFFGSTILMLSVASCVSGINEKLFFSL